MKFQIEYSEEKNLLLKETRNVCFDDVLDAVEKKKIITDLKSKNEKYKDQRLLVVKIKSYAYAVPYVIDVEKKIVFLKTVYPSRVLTKKYLQGKS